MNRLLLLLSCLLFYPANHLFSQEFHARVLDAGSKEPVPYANVLFADNRGVVTNEEGYFSFTTGQTPELIKISSMGYELLELKPEQISETLFLIPASIELKEVFLSNKNLSAKEIIIKAKEEVENNYDLNLSKKRVFFRESNINYVRNFDLHVDESTIPGIDQQLMDNIVAEVPKMSDSYKEVLGDLYGNYDSQKFRIIKAANLHNPRSTQTLEELTDRLNKLFMDNLKDKSYLKIRSGIIGVKVPADELKDELVNTSEEKPKKEKTPEELKKEKIDDEKNLWKNSSSSLSGMLGKMFWRDNLTFNLFEKTNRYKYELEGYAYIDNSTVYVISFTPRWGQDFAGKIYINTLDYGVHRLDYRNVKPLKNFRLFGISATDDVYNGKMIFVKNEDGKYRLSYMEQEKGESFGLDRPLTIIEKNKFVAGRRKQNELDLDIKLKMSQVQKLQLVVYENEQMDRVTYENLANPGPYEYKTFRLYNPEFWDGNNIMEPNAAIREFTALED
ncbi:MAG: carboxypeptidase-like regulatory domain-containing protein [Salinimicrobium sp.]